MNITAHTKTTELWRANQSRRNRAKDFFGVGTILLSEEIPEPIGEKAAAFILGEDAYDAWTRAINIVVDERDQ